MAFFAKKLKETYFLLLCKEAKYGQWGALKIGSGGFYKERAFTKLFTSDKNTDLRNPGSIWRKMKRK